jgi:hypothetical protein
MRSTSAFWAPDDADNAQGIAGAAWARERTIYAEGLPHVEVGSSDNEMSTYAVRGAVTLEWLKMTMKKKPSGWPRAFCGMPLEVEGKRWGAIVIDTRGEAIPSHEAIETFYKHYAKFLGRLLRYL